MRLSTLQILVRKYIFKFCCQILINSSEWLRRFAVSFFFFSVFWVWQRLLMVICSSHRHLPSPPNSEPSGSIHDQQWLWRFGQVMCFYSRMTCGLPFSAFIRKPGTQLLPCSLLCLFYPMEGTSETKSPFSTWLLEWKDILKRTRKSQGGLTSFGNIIRNIIF